MVNVQGYTRKDGTQVRPHRRSRPGGGGSTAGGGDVVGGVIFIVIVIVAAITYHGVGGGNHVKAEQVAAVSAGRASGLVVQVASYRDREDAQAAVRRLKARKIKADVLNSKDYAPLKTGFYVVYAGPFPDTKAGHAEANALRSRLRESLILTLSAR